jgi:hypothetical protein
MHEFVYTGLIAILIIVVDGGCKSGGVLTVYVLNLAGMLFDSRGVGVCNSVYIKPIVVQRVMLGGECSGHR